MLGNRRKQPRPHGFVASVNKARAEVELIERWAKLSAAEKRTWWTALDPAQRRVLKEAGLAGWL